MKRYMREYMFLLAVGILLGAWPVHGAADDASKSEQEIKPLVNRLGSKYFKEREEAAKELSQLGKAAVPSLQEAVLSPNAELRRRAQQLLERMEPPIRTAKSAEQPLVGKKSYL